MRRLRSTRNAFFSVVNQCSVPAAVEDNRFLPLKLRELSEIEIEL